MTILTEAELKRRMGMTIDPNSVPRHDGADHGCMEGTIRAGSDTRIVDQGSGRRGGQVYTLQELGEAGDPRFGGSATTIVVSDRPPVEEQKKRLIPRSPAELLAMLGLTKKR